MFLVLRELVMFQLHQRSPILFLVFKRTLKLSYIVKLPSGTAMPFVCLRELSVLSNHRGNEFLQPWLRTQFTATRDSVLPLLKSYLNSIFRWQKVCPPKAIFLEFYNQCSEIVTLCACVFSTQLYPKRTAGVLQNRGKCLKPPNRYFFP